MKKRHILFPAVSLGLADLSGKMRLDRTRGCVVPEGQEKNLSADGLPAWTDHQGQQRLIAVDPGNLDDTSDPVLRFSGEGFPSDDVVKEEDYQYRNLSRDDSYKELQLWFVTLSDDEITITCDWTDDAGQAHHGRYQDYSIVEDAA